MTIRILIIDYQSGNLRSAEKAFAREAAALGGGEVVVTDDPAALAEATHIVLPGVGAFGDCRAGLFSIPGMVGTLEQAVHIRKVPFLGICVGMQLLARTGYEHGEHQGLGWIDAEVVPIPPDAGTGRSLKIPHMGWNTLDIGCPSCLLLDGVEADAHFYFVHGYHMRCAAPDVVAATVDYGGPLTAVVAQDNLFGAQFHPEKSQLAGLQVIRNFLQI